MDELKDINILLVEDNATDRYAIELLIKNENLPYVLLSANSLPGALKYLKQEHIDLILLDYDLGPDTGLDLLPHVENIPVIFVTGNGSEEIAIKAIRWGASDYLIKDQARHYLKVLPLTIKNILVQKRAESALRKSEERFRELVEGTDDLIIRLNNRGRIIYTNHVSERLLGIKKDQCIGKRIFDFIHPDDMEKGKKQFKEWQKKHLETVRTESRIINTKTGKTSYILSTINLHYDKYGKLTSLNAISRDMTKQKKAEISLRESEENYRLITETASEGIYQIDISGNFTFTNKAYAQILGYQPNELIGKHYSIVIPDANLSEINNIMENVLTGLPHKGEFTKKNKLGHELPVYFSMTVLKKNGNVSGFTGIMENLTERKTLEKQIRKAQMMQTISSLAGGIAHQFNNALVGITGNIELLKMKLGDDLIDEYADRMKDAVSRMSSLTSQLLAYAEGGKYNPKKISLYDFIKKTIPIVTHTINKDISIETDIPSDIPDVEGDHAQMQMILSAVIENAVESITQKGRIRIVLRNKQVSIETAKKYPGLKPGRYSCLIIIDDGSGMDKDTLSRIFEPFFTTNFQGRGLGMAAVYGIVKNHNGWINVESCTGKGTQVSIFFPVATPMEIISVKQDNVILERANNTGTILLIEDEKMVMDITTRMLTKLGYQVVTAPTGKMAIEIVNDVKKEIDIAILDIGLPDIGGKDLYPLLKKARPNLKVIVCSGYSIDGPSREIMDAGAQSFMQKPFTYNELVEQLNKVKDRRVFMRFKPLKNTVAIPIHDPSRMYNILDISNGGLSLCHRNSDNMASDINELAIKIFNNGFYLDGLPCKVISSGLISKILSINNEKMKRCSLQFGDMTGEQMTQLKHYITNYTTAKPH